MPKTYKRLPSFNGVGAAQTATLNIPLGSTFHQFYVKYSGVTLAQLKNIRLMLNGKAYMTWKDGRDLNAMSRHNGRESFDEAGVVIIDMERYNLEKRDARELTAMGTGHPEDPTPVTTAELVIDIDGDAASPFLECHAVRSAAVPLGLIQKVRKFTRNAGGAGDFEISDIPRGDLIAQVFFRSANINAVKLERDDFVEFDRSDAINRLVQRNGVRSPQAGWFVYDPLEHGNGSEVLKTAGFSDLRFTLEMAAGGPVDIYVVYMGALEF